MENNPKSTDSTTIGILDIISGVIFIAGGLVCLRQWLILYQEHEHQEFLNWAIVLFLTAALVIYSGIMAIKRKRWKIVVVGSGIAMFAILGIPAFILTLKSKSKSKYTSNLQIGKPLIAGILTIIGGLVIGWVGIIAASLPLILVGIFEPSHMKVIYYFIAVLGGGIALALAIFTINGGVMAIKRRKWKLARAASICASIVLVGIPALILLIKSKEEFQGNK